MSQEKFSNISSKMNPQSQPSNTEIIHNNPVKTKQGSHPEKTSNIYNTPCCFVCYVPTPEPTPTPTNESCCCICSIPDSCCFESLNFCVSDCMNVCLGCLSFVDGN